MKRRRTEDPLTVSVNEVVRRVADWEDACGGKFTVQTEVIKGEDYVILKVFNVDELKIRDLVLLLDEVKHAVTCRCDFSEETLTFRFEENGKRHKRDDASEATEDQVAAEFQTLSRFRSDGAEEEDTRVVARFIATIKEVLCLLQQTKVRFDITTTPGIIALTVKNLTRVDLDMLRQIRMLEKKTDSEATVFLSPKDSQSVRIRIKKSKRTVNL
jgi:hypothetical protein